MAEAGLQIRGLVVNRSHPSFGGGDPHELRALAVEHGDTPLGPLLAALADTEAAAAVERAACAPLLAAVGPVPLVIVPLLPTDIHDVEGIGAIAERLVMPNGEGWPSS